MRSLPVALAAVFACVLPAFAAEALPAGAKVTKLDARPAAIELKGPFAYAQLTVTATLESGDAVDVTRIATISPPPFVSVTPNGLVRPTADGKAEVRIALGDKVLSVPAAVSGFKADTPVSFVRDLQPVMSKLGCNQGTCHGAAQGKNGFKLSLRGYDPIYDHRALTDDLEGRRFNRAAPERSLMLMKPAGAVPHAGGVVWQPGDPNYEMAKRWIAGGVKLDLATGKVKSIEVFPPTVTVPVIGQKQQFTVVATYPDGSRRDVSAEAFLESSNGDIATVDKTGLLTTARRGEATVLARYDGAYSAAAVVVMGDRGGYEWVQRPVNNYVDELVDAKLKRMKLVASDLCTDEEFVRRVYLDLTGLPPTAAAVRAFADSRWPSRAKRDALVDKLVGSDAFVEHWTNKWGDMLQVNRKFLGSEGADALRAWVRNAVATNMPYDRFAYAVIAASGSTVANPPAAYYKVLRDADAVMENTTQLFLAVRFNCNKCHDHPFEKWTQDQYYQTAAFFAQVTRAEDPNFKGKKIGGTNVEQPKPLVEVIADGKTGEETHIRTNTVAPPTFPFTHLGPAPDANEPRRTQFARWLTAKENPYFAKSYVNRVWSYLTGTGVIEPVDDIRAGNPATNPELLDRMTKEFVAAGFDTRALMKTVCKSRTYQLSIATTKWNRDDDINYSHALPRRLPAEVLFDTIHRATGAQSHLPGLPAGARAAQLVDGTVDLPGGFLELLGKPVRESACECERSNTMMLGPVLAMVNGPIVGDAVKDPANHIVKFTEAEKDDAKVVEEVYLSVLNRRPTADELRVGKAALHASAKDHADLMAEYAQRKAAFEAYAKTVDGKTRWFENALKAQRPTDWKPLTPVTAVSRTGDTPEAAAKAKTGSTLTVQRDGSIVVTGGKGEKVDDYTVEYDVRLDGKITGVRLEALADDKLPGKGPGRAVNGNFVLNDFKLLAKPSDPAKKDPEAAKLVKPIATFQQDMFPVAYAVDANPDTGWAVFPQQGRTQAAAFQLERPLDATGGTQLTVKMHQRFGASHTLGKFRISVTTDKAVSLGLRISPDVLAIIDTPAAKRTAEQKEKLRQSYLATDAEYQRLQRDVPAAPPSDPRVLGAQDLVWALINTPSFLFNR